MHLGLFSRSLEVGFYDLSLLNRRKSHRESVSPSELLSIAIIVRMKGYIVYMYTCIINFFVTLLLA